MKYLMVLLCGVLLASGCTHNLTELKSSGVYSRTSTAQTASMDANGDMRASYHGVGPTQLMQDPNGNWCNMPGPVGVMSVPLPGGIGYIISPNNTRIAKLSYTPKPVNGAAALAVEGLETNISEPIAAQMDAIQIALPVLQAMTKEEALATIEKWRAAQAMAPDVLDTLQAIVSLFVQ